MKYDDIVKCAQKPLDKQAQVAVCEADHYVVFGAISHKERARVSKAVYTAREQFYGDPVLDNAVHLDSLSLLYSR